MHALYFLHTAPIQKLISAPITERTRARAAASNLIYDMTNQLHLLLLLLERAHKCHSPLHRVRARRHVRPIKSVLSNPCYQIDIKIINPHPITIRPSMNLLPICCNLLVIIIDELRALHNKNLHLTIARSFLGLVCLVVYCHKTQI